MWRVYVLKEPPERDPERSVRYVGYTKKSLKERLYRHIRDALRKKADGNWFQNDHRAHWIRLLNNLGLTPTIEEIEVGEGEEWRQRERFWISHFRDAGANLINLLAGGEGPSEYNPTPATRLKLSVAVKRVWQDPNQRQRRLVGITDPIVIERRNASIREAYTKPEVIERGSRHLLTVESKANRLIAYRKAQAEGRVGRKVTYTETDLQTSVDAYVRKEGCYRCIAEVYRVKPHALLKRLMSSGIDTASCKGHPCKMQGAFHRKKTKQE